MPGKTAMTDLTEPISLALSYHYGRSNHRCNKHRWGDPRRDTPSRTAAMTTAPTKVKSCIWFEPIGFHTRS